MTTRKLQGKKPVKPVTGLNDQGLYHVKCASKCIFISNSKIQIVQVVQQMMGVRAII